MFYYNDPLHQRPPTLDEYARAKKMSKYKHELDRKNGPTYFKYAIVKEDGRPIAWARNKEEAEKIVNALNQQQTKRFKLHWIGGKTEVIEGNSISDAFTNSGYGAGAINQVDWYEEIP